MSLTLLRLYINDQTQPYEYQDELLNEILGQYTYTEGAAAFMWGLKTNNLEDEIIKRQSEGVESTEYVDLDKRLNFYKERQQYYIDEEAKKSGGGTVKLFTVCKPSVAGVVPDEYCETTC